MADAKPKAIEPKASRPHMPGYGILDANEGGGLLPWEWAEERLTASRNYWIATTWLDGRPHCTAVWAIWMDDAVYFSAGWKSRKAINLSANPRIVICPENADHAVSLEGVAETTDDATTIERFCAVYNRKYHWNLTPRMVRELGPVFFVRPQRVLGIDADPGKFQGSATRWLFRH